MDRIPPLPRFNCASIRLVRAIDPVILPQRRRERVNVRRRKAQVQVPSPAFGELELL